MTLGVAGSWRSMQPKKKRCERCGLYYTEKLNKCSHCGDLDDRGLQELLKRHEEGLEENAALGRYFAIGAVAIGVLLLLSLL
jgi:hypothetical protein